VRDLKGRRFGLPNWKHVEIDFTRAQALRGLENALSLEGLRSAMSSWSIRISRAITAIGGRES
jgi:hypothetical protein